MEGPGPCFNSGACLNKHQRKYTNNGKTLVQTALIKTQPNTTHGYIQQRNSKHIMDSLDGGGSIQHLLSYAKQPAKTTVASSASQKEELTTQSLRQRFKPTKPSNVYHNNCDKYQYNARKRLLLRLKRLKNSYRTIKTDNGRIYYFCEHTGVTKWDIQSDQTIVQEVDEFPTLKDYKLSWRKYTESS